MQQNDYQQIADLLNMMGEPDNPTVHQRLYYGGFHPWKQGQVPYLYKGIQKNHPDDWELLDDPEEWEKLRNQGYKSILMGLEDNEIFNMNPADLAKTIEMLRMQQWEPELMRQNWRNLFGNFGIER